MSRPDVTKALQAFGCTVKEAEPMAAHTSFKIGGAADCFVSTGDLIQAALILRHCTEKQIPLLVVGNGSNLLVSDSGIDGVVLHVDANAIEVSGTRMTVQAGASLTRACLTACEHGLSGLEFAYGIPGTMGGGVYMNAGAYGGEMSQVVTLVEGFDMNGEPFSYTRPELMFSHRYSRLMDEEKLITHVTFQLQPGDREALLAEMVDFNTRRAEKQPLTQFSAGSTFKRPANGYASAMIDQCGLKGFAIGGAQVSEKHAGFCINKGGTAADFLALIAHVQGVVQSQFGTMLEPEVRILGEDAPVKEA